MGMRLNGLRKAKVIIDRMILESSEFAERDVVVLHGVQWNDIAGDELYLGDGTPLEIREWTGRTRMHNGFRLDEAVFSIGLTVGAVSFPLQISVPSMACLRPRLCATARLFCTELWILLRLVVLCCARVM